MQFQAPAEPLPLVSVVIPVFNRVDQARLSVLSVLRQTFQSIEIVLIDDCSSEPGLDAVAALDDRIRLIRLDRNAGAPTARNRGFEEAKGRYVALLDADDQWVEHKLERQLALIADIPADQPFISATNVWVGGHGAPVPLNHRAPAPDEDIAPYLMIEDCALQTSTLLLPRAVALATRFRLGLHRHQDWDFILRVLNGGARLVYTHEPLSTYDMTSDPRRISLQKKAFLRSVEWFRIAGDLVSADIMQRYFVRSSMGGNIVRHPFALGKAFLQVAALRPRGAPGMLLACARQNLDKLRRHAVRPRATTTAPHAR